MMQLEKQYKEHRTWAQTKKLMKRKWIFYALFIPFFIYLCIFSYYPMPGIQIAFKDFTFRGGIWGSDWARTAGELDLFKHFRRFLTNGEFPRLLKNTLTITLMDLFLGFPIPIIFALFINEMKHEKYKRIMQSMSYLPHFVSMVVVYAVIFNFFSLNGFFNGVLTKLGMERVNVLGDKDLYKWVYWGSDIWQNCGWSSIIFLAQLSRTDMGQYEAAEIDGANRWQKMWYLTMPTLRPLIVHQFILCVGGILSVGTTKVLVLMNDMVRSTAETIGYYVYYTGLLTINQYSYATAIGLFNAVIALTLTFTVNWLGKKIEPDGGVW